ncbi:MAG TPA: sigma factor, partial [Polyangiaceae bacterium]|nr:sigma factor [Polyangiaceae bacterium]
MRQMFLDGQRQWPLVELAYDAFERHWQSLLGDRGPDAAGDGADLFLSCACVEGDAEALRVFERETRPVARAAITRIRRDQEFVEDCLQDLWEKLLWGPNAKIKKYAGRGALKAWVRVTATRAALDRCRALGLAIARHTELTDGVAFA